MLVDLDGTLADSLPGLRRAYDRFMDNHGCRGSGAEFEEFNGPPLRDIICALAQRHRIESPIDILIQEYKSLIHAEMPLTPPAQGAEVFLKHHYGRGRKIAVVTSSLRESAFQWLNSNRLLSYVDAIVGGDDVERGKPDPAPYTRALNLFECRGSEAIAVEDSRPGAASARSAGIATYAIAGPGQRSGWPEGVTFVTCLGDIAFA